MDQHHRLIAFTIAIALLLLLPASAQHIEEESSAYPLRSLAGLNLTSPKAGVLTYQSCTIKGCNQCIYNSSGLLSCLICKPGYTQDINGGCAESTCDPKSEYLNLTNSSCE